MVEGGPFGRPAFSVYVDSVLDCCALPLGLAWCVAGLLPSWMPPCRVIRLDNPIILH